MGFSFLGAENRARLTGGAEPGEVAGSTVGTIGHKGSEFWMGGLS